MRFFALPKNWVQMNAVLLKRVFSGGLVGSVVGLEKRNLLGVWATQPEVEERLKGVQEEDEQQVCRYLAVRHFKLSRSCRVFLF